MADVYENDRQVVIVVDLAGVDRDHLKVTLDGRAIQIIGRRYSPCPPGSLRIRQMEIDTGEFRRRIVLPGAVMFEESECTYKDGFLNIVLPKETKPEVIQIPVESE
jgi:HSP20 family protein